jgi:hypothetical protein
MDPTAINVPSIRAALARERISRAKFAAACHLSTLYVSHILSEQVRPGELARIKVHRGLAALGLDGQVSAGA